MQHRKVFLVFFCSAWIHCKKVISDMNSVAHYNFQEVYSFRAIISKNTYLRLSVFCLGRLTNLMQSGSHQSGLSLLDSTDRWIQKATTMINVIVCDKQAEILCPVTWCILSLRFRECLSEQRCGQLTLRHFPRLFHHICSAGLFQQTWV